MTLAMLKAETLLWLSAIFVSYVASVQLHRLFRKLPPGPLWSVPVLGDFVYFNRTGLIDFLISRIRTYGSVFWINFFGVSVISINSFTDVQKLLLAEGELIEGCWPPSVVALNGAAAITTVTGAAHKALRRTLEPSMKEGVLRAGIPAIVSSIHECLETWAERGHFEGSSEFKTMTFQVLMRTALDVRSGDFSPKELDALHASLVAFANGLFSPPINLPGFAYYKAKKARAEMDAVMTRHIARLRERLAAGQAKDQLADRLIAGTDEDGQPFSLPALLDNFAVILFAGHDTTALTCLMILYSLGKQPRILAKLKAEQSQVMEELGQEITAEALDAMRYTEAVAKEGLRWKTPVASVFRRALCTFQLGPHTIPKGSMLQLGVGPLLKLDPRWADQVGDAAPDQFYPERWLTEAGKKAGYFMPFGAGPRMCLGWRLAMLELKVFLALLARGYRWELLNPDAKWEHFLFERPADGFPVKIAKL